MGSSRSKTCRNTPNVLLQKYVLGGVLGVDTFDLHQIHQHFIIFQNGTRNRRGRIPLFPILTDNRASINFNSEQFKHDLLKDEMKKNTDIYLAI